VVHGTVLYTFGWKGGSKKQPHGDQWVQSNLKVREIITHGLGGSGKGGTAKLDGGVKLNTHTSGVGRRRETAGLQQGKTQVKSNGQ